MKSFTKFFAVLVTGLVISINVSAQLSATALATAEIYAALRITKATDLNFGVIIPSGTAGDVTITPAGVVTRTNNTAHPSSVTTTAEFNVIGEPSATYAITVTAPLPITLTSGGNTMQVTSLTRTPAANGTLDGTTGTQDIFFGGVLVVGANQAAGTYTSPANAITVDINYN